MNTLTLSTLAVLALATTASFAAPRVQDMAAMPASMGKMVSTTAAFKGVEVNGGMAILSKTSKGFSLRVSEDFKLPKSPAPHWQVIDGKGNTYLLNQFNIVGNKHNREVMLPKYITSISKVQVWCSFAEVVLGEAAFAKTINLR